MSDMKPQFLEISYPASIRSLSVSENEYEESGDRKPDRVIRSEALRVNRSSSTVNMAISFFIA